MFKDLYKNANDKIPTQDAYLRVMEKVSSAPRKTQYSYGKFAALAACFILTVSMISVYEKFAPSVEEPFSVTAPENLVLSTEVTPMPRKTETPAPKNEVVAPLVTPEPVAVLEVTPEITPEVTPEAAAPEATPTSQTNALAKNQGIPENIGILVARFTLGHEVTIEQYYEYLGKNIEEMAVLPEGFVNETPDIHMLSLEADQDFNDRWTFYFSGGENSVFITTTKDTENIINIINNSDYTKTNISGYEAVVFEEDLQKAGCLAKDGIGYTVSSYGISDEDFEALLISLTK